MNRYSCIGNVGKDAEVKTMDSGLQVIKFNVAVTEKFKDRAGEQKEQTTWVNCVKFVQAGQSVKIAEYLKKGTKVLVEGKPSASAYKNSQGEPAASLECVVQNIELLGSKPASENQGQVHEAKPIAADPADPANISAGNEDDLPF